MLIYQQQNSDKCGEYYNSQDFHVSFVKMFKWTLKYDGYRIVVWPAALLRATTDYTIIYGWQRRSSGSEDAIWKTNNIYELTL